LSRPLLTGKEAIERDATTNREKDENERECAVCVLTDVIGSHLEGRYLFAKVLEFGGVSGAWDSCLALSKTHGRQHGRREAKDRCCRDGHIASSAHGGSIDGVSDGYGWHGRCDEPLPIDVCRVYETLRNPRYAGLSIYKGEVLARGHWPAYVSERRHVCWS
jgi:hypothetical protein